MRRLENFDNEYLFVLPPALLQSYASSPIFNNLYVTDLGFFPNADYHYVSRKHGTNTWVMIFCTNGSGTVVVNKKTYAMKQHSFIILPPNVAHKYFTAANDPWDIYWVHFRGKLATSYPCVYPSFAFYLEELPINQIKSVMELFWFMIKTFQPGFSFNRELYVSQLLGALLSGLSVNKSDVTTGSTYVDTAIQYIYNNISSPIKLEDIARKLGISVSYLSRTFRKVTQVSVNQFITSAKVARASHYLRFTNIPIQQIAARLGYTDSYYFSRVFKKEYQVSPREYRQQKTS
ncbi:AraC family transcriptional regulator [Secundilactobacillus pentosiphilus]|uniref:AraC family transcriptional regulator n=1 Tax=Secundilactobacillus pentosiphilus TaxID=1714682 RepID=A0A1Z5IQC0_9LACO|nr:AraC family transcriptional regulator [Secundilactobacillus pentosiphilus]GAX03964.1 AraC family transcriptional regulator [Secundilactobacillus pentosiphilus]GAX06096.1 AraC family transcriptional regulator [Secundilactobacillus pentosiphilus]